MVRCMPIASFGISLQLVLFRYITYGEEEWRQATLQCLKRMELYDDTGVYLQSLSHSAVIYMLHIH